MEMESQAQRENGCYLWVLEFFWENKSVLSIKRKRTWKENRKKERKEKRKEWGYKAKKKNDTVQKRADSEKWLERCECKKQLNTEHYNREEHKLRQDMQIKK